jgi:hypothetical protein
MSTDVSEVNTVSIFRVKDQVKEETCMKKAANGARCMENYRII